jgi:hypothetical protein
LISAEPSRTRRPAASDAESLSEKITAAIVILECAEEKLLNLLPIEEIVPPEDLAAPHD